MAGVSLTGRDTAIIDGRIFTDFADGDTCSLEFQNDIVTATVGKNGAAIYAYNATGAVVNVTLRLLRGSADDKYLNLRFSQFKIDPPSFVLMTGSFVKRVGKGFGLVNSDIYQMSGGVILRPPVAKENQSGDTEQAVSIWSLQFTNNTRVIA